MVEFDSEPLKTFSWAWPTIMINPCHNFRLQSIIIRIKWNQWWFVLEYDEESTKCSIILFVFLWVGWFVMFSVHVCWQIIDKSKRDCREEVEILLRYGQTHHYIVSLRCARKKHNRLSKDQKICKDLNFVKEVHVTIKYLLKRASNFQISTRKNAV